MSAQSAEYAKHRPAALQTLTACTAARDSPLGKQLNRCSVKKTSVTLGKTITVCFQQLSGPSSCRTCHLLGNSPMRPPAVRNLLQRVSALTCSRAGSVDLLGEGLGILAKGPKRCLRPSAGAGGLYRETYCSFVGNGGIRYHVSPIYALRD